MSAESPPGLELAALTSWLDQHHPGLRQGPLAAELIVGGLSNLTYDVGDGHTRWALRRPPLGHTLPTAHDMSREFRVISALRGTPVAVAEAIALCEDPEVLGAPFYLMSFVDGVVLGRPAALPDPEAAARCCGLLVDTLLALHAIDAESVGLADFGRPEGFLDRQLRRWTAQWHASETQPRAELHELIGALETSLPEQSAPAIVHGDYRLTNVIFAPDLTRIGAVVDWEMATLGDPLTDVGMLVVYQELSSTASFVMPHFPAEAGFSSAEEMVARYAAGSDRDLSDLAWYTGFGWFKLAVIAEGIHARHLQGKAVGGIHGEVGQWVPTLLRNGLTAMG